jgi:tetratricopeptide (TPR) repeat protein
LARGEYEKAISQFARARELAGDTATVLSYLAQGYAWAGDKTKAQGVLSELQRPERRFVSPWEFALVYDALGDKNRALVFLEKAADQHAARVVMMAVDPRLDDLHADPRFKQLQQRIRVPQPTANPIA